jgi:hydrogenase expression/formation protein HypE
VPRWSPRKEPVPHITDINSTMKISCPVPVNKYDTVTLAHGGGGRLSERLIHDLFIKELDNPWLNKAHDGAVMEMKGNIAFSTDSFVVNPLFFPGGNIGDLAVNGTVNDLVCCGAVPEYLSLGLIIEEGLKMDDLRNIIVTIKNAATKANVKIVTGDTKVVEKGKGDKIFINTSGVGTIPEGIFISPERCSQGDLIIVTGNIADHGIAILSSREGLSFESTIRSDTAPLIDLSKILFEVTKEIHVLRDPTRGGVASALNEICSSSGKGILLDEKMIPVSDEVKGACEIMGFDPLYIANEGKLIIILPEKYSGDVLKAIRKHPLGKNAAIIGKVTSGPPVVKIRTIVGSTRIVDMISGEQLPRIC